jgi:hypothetical protein
VATGPSPTGRRAWLAGQSRHLQARPGYYAALDSGKPHRRGSGLRRRQGRGQELALSRRAAPREWHGRSQQASPAPSSWHAKLGLRGRQEPPAGARVTASSPLPDLMPVSQVRKRRVFAGPLTMCMERLSTRAPPIKVGWVGGAFEPTLQAARPWACEASPHLSSGAGHWQLPSKWKTVGDGDRTESPQRRSESTPSCTGPAGTSRGL